MTAKVADEDIAYEEDVLRNPYSLRSWLRYLEWKNEAPLPTRTILYERALHHLPGSYKLWFAYLQERIKAVKGRCITHPTYEIINRTFERALVFMHKMPRIWIEYLNFLTLQHQYTRTRRTFDRALRALPVSQHDRIWKLYLKFVRSIPDCPDTVVRVYRRYLRLHPTEVEDYIEFLVGAKLYEEAIYQLAKVLNAEETAREKEKKATEKAGKRKELWLQLCDLVSKNPDKSKDLNVDAAIRAGVRRFTDEVGRLWTALADYYIRLGHFEKARDVFEEALGTVTSVKDFAQIWDAYVLFEDEVVAAKMKAAGSATDGDVALELDLLVARYEALVSRRALLMSSVMLRQNPNNVREWHKRAKLFEDPVQVIETYNTALKTVDPLNAKGKPHTLWVNFANFYEAQGELEYARQVFERGTEATFRSPDELAALWCEYAEFELRHRNYDAARTLMGRATAVPSAKRAASMSEVQKKLHKQAKLWGLAADLEESFGTFETTKAVYERALDLKVATPLLVISYAQYLEQNKYFEESFKAYERGVQLFTYPYVFDLWLTYLTKFVARYGGRKLERARDLFEQALEKAPQPEAKVLYMMFAALEEEHGLARHAMAVYDRAVKSLAEEDRPAMYLIYIARAAEFFGITRTRQIFEQAIEALPERYAREMCLRYAELEKKLGEIDRARAIYVHCSQYCDPRAETGFWKTWSDFEVRHGNQDTFKEMLRVRRSVQASYATSVMPFVAKDVLQPGAEQPRASGDKMAALEAQATSAAEDEQMPPAFGVNPDAIDVEGGERPAKQRKGVEGGAETQLEQKELPAGLFGSAKPAEGGEEKLGALERLRRKK